AGNILADGGLENRDEARSIFFFIELDDDLAVIELLQLRRDGKPEARAAAADKGGKRFQHRARLAVFAGMLAAIFFGRGAQSVFHFDRRLIGDEKRDVVGKPEIEKRKVLHVVREKLRLQLMSHESAENQKQQRGSKHFPAVLDGEFSHAEIKAA